MKIKACIPTVLAALSLFILPASAEPLSPPGTGTVIDSGTDEDGKEFYTIQAPDKAVFYLIIDRQRGTENVYFLDAVAAKDLLSLAEPEKKHRSRRPQPPRSRRLRPSLHRRAPAISGFLRRCWPWWPLAAGSGITSRYTVPGIKFPIWTRMTATSLRRGMTIPT